MPATDLGNVLYIGDSITHGYGAPSYRWALHKIFVDNGIEYEEIGIEVGNRSGGVDPETVYIARPFKNVHAAMCSQRAYETSGRLHPGDSKRFDGTDIFDWLGLEKPGDNEKQQAPNDKRKLKARPDTAFILLGTNDLLSEKEVVEKGGVGKNIAKLQKLLIDKKKGDIPVIVDALHKSNPKAKVYVLSVPAWGDLTRNNTPKDYEAVVKKYNKACAGVFKKMYVDLNKGLVDIACTDKPGKAVAAFMNPQDKLHPSLQGDLIMAGHVARTMGIAGRTAGMIRKAASAFSYDAAGLLEQATEKTDVTLADNKLLIKAGKKMETPWKEGEATREGFSAELVPTLGDGARGGWDKAGKIVLTIGNGKHTGKLVISECYIMWNKGAVLYPIDMSKNREAVRVAWIPGSASQHVDKGFYVWLGDMLIGEGLPDATEKYNGVRVQNVSDVDLEVAGLAADPVSVAPVSKGLVREAAAIIYDEDKDEPAPAAAEAADAKKK